MNNKCGMKIAFSRRKTNLWNEKESDHLLKLPITNFYSVLYVLDA